MNNNYIEKKLIKEITIEELEEKLNKLNSANKAITVIWEGDAEMGLEYISYNALSYTRKSGDEVFRIEDESENNFDTTIKVVNIDKIEEDLFAERYTIKLKHSRVKIEF